jgi:hypothetical protein
MTELSQKALRIIQEANLADGPTLADRQRVRDKLITKLGAGALLSGTVIAASATSSAASAGAAAAVTSSAGAVTSGVLAASGASAGLGIAAKITLVSAIVGAVGVGATAVPWNKITAPSTTSAKTSPIKSTPVTPPTATTTKTTVLKAVEDKAPVQAEQAPVAPVVAEASVQARQTTVAPVVAPASLRTIKPRLTRTVLSEETPSQLEGEIELIRAAQVALQQGDSARALAELDKHKLQFPKGVLFQEREAARAVALCELGRIDEGRQVAQRLLIESPHSPMAQRIHRSCDK